MLARSLSLSLSRAQLAGYDETKYMYWVFDDVFMCNYLITLEQDWIHCM